MKTGRGILELIREKKVLTEEQIAKVFDPAAMTGQTAAGMSRRSRLFAPRCWRRPSAALVLPARGEQPAADGWRPFTATWTLSGQRTLLPTEGERPGLDRPPDGPARR